MTYFIAFFIGFTIIIAMVQNARLAQEVTNIQTTVLNFITGLFGITAIYLFTGVHLSDFDGLKTMPLIGYIGGMVAVAVVFLSTVVVRKVSVIAASMLMYTGQMLASFAIDYYRGIYLSPYKLLGCGLIVLGIYFNGYIESKKIRSVNSESLQS